MRTVSLPNPRPHHTHLSDNALDEFVHGKGNVGMNGEHLSQRIFILGRVYVAIQQAPHLVQESWVIIFYLNVHCGKEGRGEALPC